MLPPLYNFLTENLSKLGHNYENFLESRGGFPSINAKKCWTLSKTIPPHYNRAKADYFDFLANQIINEAERFIMLPEIEKFIIKFNAKWMEVRTPSKKLEGRLESLSIREEIWFNSKNENYSWLSNLFETLVFSSKPVPGIFSGVESAYKTYKAILAGEDVETVLRISRIINQKAAQKINVELPDELKVPLMCHLIHCKFLQNQILANNLQATAPRQLIEHTDHVFWGDGSSTSSAETGNGLNMLGKILMSQRECYPGPPDLMADSKASDSHGSERDDKDDDIDALTRAFNEITVKGDLNENMKSECDEYS